MHDDNAGSISVRIEIVIIDDLLDPPPGLVSMAQKKRTAFMTSLCSA
jgi:hypothetical protein